LPQWAVRALEDLFDVIQQPFIGKIFSGIFRNSAAEQGKDGGHEKDQDF
jgi:hypothetical protein